MSSDKVIRCLLPRNNGNRWLKAFDAHATTKPEGSLFYKLYPRLNSNIIMVQLRSGLVLALVAGANAFAPQASKPVRADIALDMANGSKRKAVMKVRSRHLLKQS